MADDSGSLSQDEIDALLNMGDGGGGDAGGDDGGLGDLLGGGGGGDGGGDDLNLDSLLGGGAGDTGGDAGGMGLDQEALNALAGAVGGGPPAGGGGGGGGRPASSGRRGGGERSENVELLMDVTLRFTVELGRTQMYIKDVLMLGEGSIVELDKQVGDEVDILINDRLFGRGRLIVLEEYFGVQITHILDPLTQFRSL